VALEKKSRHPVADLLHRARRGFADGRSDLLEDRLDLRRKRRNIFIDIVGSRSLAPHGVSSESGLRVAWVTAPINPVATPVGASCAPGWPAQAEVTSCQGANGFATPRKAGFSSG